MFSRNVQTTDLTTRTYTTFREQWTHRKYTRSSVITHEDYLPLQLQPVTRLNPKQVQNFNIILQSITRSLAGLLLHKVLQHSINVSLLCINSGLPERSYSESLTTPMRKVSVHLISIITKIRTYHYNSAYHSLLMTLESGPVTSNH